MVSDAHKRAIAKYRKQHVKQLIVRFYPKDMELYAFVKERGGAVYLRELAEEQMEQATQL